MIKKPVISVVIGSYNQEKKLNLVLNSLKNQQLKEHIEILVIDSGSDDETATMLKNQQINMPSHITLKSIIKHNQGKSAARNLGIKEATSDLIFITDSDMIAHPNLLQTHLNAQKENPGSFFQGCTYNLSHYHYPVFEENMTPYINPLPKNHQKLGWFYFLTGNLSGPKSSFGSGFDENFEHYGWEDLELGFRRIKKEKHSLFFLANAKNYHYHILSKQEEIKRCVLKGSSAKLFYQKHPEVTYFVGKHPLSKIAHHFNKKIPKQLNYLEKKGLTSSKKWIRNFSFWYLKESFFWKGLYH